MQQGYELRTGILLLTLKGVEEVFELVQYRRDVFPALVTVELLCNFKQKGIHPELLFVCRENLHPHTALLQVRNGYTTLISVNT